MDDVNVKRIDAPFPEQWREGLAETMQVGLADFLREMKAIRESLENLSITPTAQTQTQLAKFYTEGGSRSEGASLPPNMGTSVGGVVVPESVQREQLSAMAQQTNVMPPTPGPSPNASTPKTLQEMMAGNEAALGEHPIALPQHYGGKYTLADIAMIGARLSNNKAESAQKEAEEAAKEGNVQKQKEAEVQAKQLATRASNRIDTATNSIPTWQAAYGTLSQYGGAAMQWSKGLGAYATSLGYQPGESSQNDLNIFGLQFRPPWNSTALAGGRQMLSDFGTAMTVPGASPGTISGFRQQIAGRGWQESNGTLSQPGEEMMKVMTHLFGRGGVFQELSENPEVLDLLDKATRMGTKGLDEMTKSIEGIPDAAEAAHETVAQMVKDMNSFGELNQSIGGTHAAGQEMAKGIASLTGIPAASFQSFMESTYFQGKLYQQTGTLPMMQGSLSPMMRTQAMVKAVQEMGQMAGHFSGHTETTLGGFQHKVSGQEEKVSMIHGMFQQMGINMQPEVIQKLLNEDPHRLKVQGELQSAAEGWMQQTKGIAQEAQKDPAKAAALEKALSAATVGGHNFGQLLQTMAHQTTVNGRGERVRMFSQEDIRNIRTNFGEGYNQHGAKLAQAKYENVQKIIQDKARKNAEGAGSPGQTVTIELGPAAKKLLRLPNKRYRMKLEANAGGGNPVSNGLTGYTEEPAPTLNNQAEWGNLQSHPTGYFSFRGH